MKIRMKEHLGGLITGEIYDGAVSPNKENAYVFDYSGAGWFLSGHQFQIISEEETSGETANLAKAFGQEMQKLEVTFK